MAQREIKVIIFDLGNVLVDFNHMHAAERISRFCVKNPKEIFELFFDSKVTKDFEEGKVSPQEFFLKVKEMLDLNLPYESFVHIWNDIFFLSGKNREVYSLANKLRERYHTTVLTNINILHYEYLKKHFPVFNVFHRVFTSFELGVAKPSQDAYKKILKELNVAPEEVFYTDDRIELVESAKQLGIKGYVFSAPTQLRKDLKESGVDLW